MMLVVDCPQHVPAFIGYLKSEISHCINRLLGRRQRTIWQEGYDAPMLIDVASVRRYIKYIYANPTRAFLVPDIAEHPGVSSWEMFTSGKYRANHRRVSRPQLFRLYSPALGVNEQKRIVEELKKLPGSESEFVLEPFAWVDTFPELQGVDLNQLKREILEDVAKELREIREAHAREKKRYIGATELRRQSMLLEHTPKKFSKKMICIAEDKELRKSFIRTFKHLADLARAAFKRWKEGDFSAEIPAGMFAPCLPCRASALYPV
jgi:hypothetical protein